MADTTTYRALPDSPPTQAPQPPRTSDSAPVAGGAQLPAPPPPPTPPAGSAHRPGRRRAAAAAGLAALVALAGGAGGVVGHQLADDRGGRPAASSPATTPLVSSGGGATLDVAAVLAATEAAVVDVQSNGARGNGQGTGVVYSGDGLVLTNAHVVAGATTVTVTTPSDRQARRASVVGADAARDIAVLRLADTDGLTVAQLGSSADVEVGQDVVAIGNALGLRGDPSVTRGIVSALDRSIGDLTGLLQTDAAINSGNSGGPLVNAAGQVIGINTAIAVANNAQNIGFAIPIDAARGIAERIASGTPSAAVAFLGVSTMDNQDATTGATVAGVTPGSPAQAAGVAVGDVIVAVDDSSVSGAAALARLIGDKKPGQSVTLTVLRDGSETKLTAKLGQTQ